MWKFLVAFDIVVLALALPAVGQTWTGNVSGQWGNPNNWSPVGLPVNDGTASLIFGASANTAMTAPSYMINFMRFQAGAPAYSLAPVGLNTLSFHTVDNDPAIRIDTNNAVTFTIPVQIAGNNLSVIGTGSGTLALPNISGAGSLTMADGAGTLLLNGATSTYGGGTFVNSGTLLLGNGTAIPTGGNVTVTGGQFNTGGLANGDFTNSPNAIGTVSLSGTGTFRIPSGAADYHLNKLAMTGGSVDMTGAGAAYLHFRNAGAGITTNASSTTAVMTGGPLTRLQNDTGSPLTIAVAAGTTPSRIDLDTGIPLSLGNGLAGFREFTKVGAGTMRLSSLSNTADISVNEGALRVDDMASNGGVGALGSGKITLSSLPSGVGGTLAYGGPTATSIKALSLDSSATIQVLTPGTILTLNGVISETNFPKSLTVAGPGAAGSSTLSLGVNNTYNGATLIRQNAVVATTSVANVTVTSPTGSDPVNLGYYLGDNISRGTLLLTGTDPTYSTNRRVGLAGLYGSGSGGAIGVQNMATNLIWSGPIYNDGTPGALIKNGPGTLTLTNATNTYTGGTYVEEGTLNIGAGGAVIPANSDVTVYFGATLVHSTPNSNASAPLRKLALDGGTFRVPAGFADFYLNRLAMTGGVVDLTGTSQFWMRFTGSNPTITTDPSSSTATWIGSGTSRIQNDAATPLTISVAFGSTANRIDLDAGIILSRFGGNSTVVKAGGGTMRLTNLANDADFIVQQGALRVDDVATGGVGPLGSGSLTLNGGRLAYGGASATLTKPFTIDTLGGGIEVVNPNTTLTLASLISGYGALDKSGPGVLKLGNSANNFASGISISGGFIDVSDDAQLGDAVVTVNPAGTLRYTTSANTRRTFNLNGGTLEALFGGTTLTLNGAAVNGGFLRGSIGTFELTGGTTLSGTTSLNTTTINQTGNANLINFTNGGSINVAHLSGQQIVWNGGGNAASGILNVNGFLTLRGADWYSNGRFAINPGSDVTVNPDTLGPGGIVLGAGSVTTIGIYNPANGQVTTGGQFRFGLHDLRVQGGFFRNNSDVVGRNLVIDYGSSVVGAGFFACNVQPVNGGRFSPGNSVGRAGMNSFEFSPGGVYDFEINNATGTAGPTDASGSGWDLSFIERRFPSDNPPPYLAVTATPFAPFTINLISLPGPTGSGGQTLRNFNPDQSYSWLAFDVDPAAAISNWDATAFRLNTSQFTSPFTGSFSIVRDNAIPFQIYIKYTPPGLPGDYNGNGEVDAADYVVWRKNVGSTNPLPNDAIGGTIGSAQYDQWRSHFGQTASSNSNATSGAVVPEPVSAELMLFAAIGELVALSERRLRVVLSNSIDFGGHPRRQTSVVVGTAA